MKLRTTGDVFDGVKSHPAGDVDIDNIDVVRRVVRLGHGRPLGEDGEPLDTEAALVALGYGKYSKGVTDLAGGVADAEWNAAVDKILDGKYESLGRDDEEQVKAALEGSK